MWQNRTREEQCGFIMMTSSSGNIFRVTGPLYREFTGHRWIPPTKASDVELWCFLWSAPWINGWVNNREAGDLRRHRAHYDVIVVITTNVIYCFNYKGKHITPCYEIVILVPHGASMWCMYAYLPLKAKYHYFCFAWKVQSKNNR